MSPETKNREDEEAPCAFDALLWVMVVLLMLCFGGFALLGMLFSLGPLSAPVVGAAVAAGVFCSALLAMLLLAYLALTLAVPCLAMHRRDSGRLDDAKTHSMD